MQARIRFLPYRPLRTLWIAAGWCIAGGSLVAQTFDNPPRPPDGVTVFPGGNVVPGYPAYSGYPGYPNYPIYPAYPVYPNNPPYPPHSVQAPAAQGYPHDRNLNLDNRTPTLREAAPRIGTPMPSHNVVPNGAERYRRLP